PPPRLVHSYFFLHDPSTTEIYTLSLHDALPIYEPRDRRGGVGRGERGLGEPAQRQRSLGGGGGPCLVRPSEGDQVRDGQQCAGVRDTGELLHGPVRPAVVGGGGAGDRP